MSDTTTTNLVAESPLSEAWVVFRRSGLALFGLGLLLIIIVVSVVGPFIYAVDPFDIIWAPFTEPGVEAVVGGLVVLLDFVVELVAGGVFENNVIAVAVHVVGDLGKVVARQGHQVRKIGQIRGAAAADYAAVDGDLFAVQKIQAFFGVHRVGAGGRILVVVLGLDPALVTGGAGHPEFIDLAVRGIDVTITDGIDKFRTILASLND